MQSIRESIAIGHAQVNQLYGHHSPHPPKPNKTMQRSALIDQFCHDRPTHSPDTKEYFLKAPQNNLMRSEFLDTPQMKRMSQTVVQENDQVYKINVENIDENVDYEKEAYRLDQELKATQKIQELLSKSQARQQQFKFQSIIEKEREKKGVLDNCSNNLLRSLSFCDVGYKVSNSRTTEHERVFHLVDEFLFYYNYIPKTFSPDHFDSLTKSPKAGLNLLTNLICKYDTTAKVLTLTFQSHLMLDFRHYKLMDNPTLFIDHFREKQTEFQTDRLKDSKLLSWQINDSGNSSRIGYRIHQYYHKLKLIKQQEKKTLYSQQIKAEHSTAQLDMMQKDLEDKALQLSSQKQQSILFSTILQEKKGKEEQQVNQYQDTSISQVVDPRTPQQKRSSKRKAFSQYALKALLNCAQKKHSTNIGTVLYQVLPDNHPRHYAHQAKDKLFFGVFSFLGFKVAMHDVDDQLDFQLSNVLLGQPPRTDPDTLYQNEAALVVNINAQELVFMDLWQLKQKVKEVSPHLLEFMDRHLFKIQEAYVKQMLVQLAIIKHIKKMYKHQLRSDVLANPSLLTDPQVVSYSVACFLNSVFGCHESSDQIRDVVVGGILQRYGRHVNIHEVDYRNRNVLQYLCMACNIELGQKVKVDNEEQPVAASDILSVQPMVQFDRNLETFFDMPRTAQTVYQYQVSHIKRLQLQGIGSPDDLDKVFHLKNKLRFTALKVQTDILLLNYYISEMEVSQALEYQVKVQSRVVECMGLANPINVNLFLLVAKFHLSLHHYHDCIYFSKLALQLLKTGPALLYHKQLQLLLLLLQAYQLTHNNKQYQDYLALYDHTYDQFIQHYEEQPNQNELMLIFKLQEQRKNLLPSL